MYWIYNTTVMYCIYIKYSATVPYVCTGECRGRTRRSKDALRNAKVVSTYGMLPWEVVLTAYDCKCLLDSKCIRSNMLSKCPLSKYTLSRGTRRNCTRNKCIPFCKYAQLVNSPRTCMCTAMHPGPVTVTVTVTVTRDPRSPHLPDGTVSVYSTIVTAVPYCTVLSSTTVYTCDTLLSSTVLDVTGST